MTMAAPSNYLAKGAVKNVLRSVYILYKQIICPLKMGFPFIVRLCLVAQLEHLLVTLRKSIMSLNNFENQDFTIYKQTQKAKQSSKLNTFI